MLKLCGFPVSNYYNKVKFVLLEKSIPFEEVLITLDNSEALRRKSPLAKIPFIETPEGTLCESQVILEYLEAGYTEHPLLPADPWAAAKTREIVTFLDLHLELTARPLYPQAFLGERLDPGLITETAAKLEAHIAGFRRLQCFEPYIAGTEFSWADCVAFVHLPVIAMCTRAVLRRDLLEEGGIPWRSYTKMIAARPAAIRLSADQRQHKRGATLKQAHGEV